MAGVKGIFQLFASRPGTGSAEVRQIIPADAFGSRENSAQAGSTAGRIFRQKVSPRRKAPKTRGRKSPLKKYGRRKERSYEWPVHSPFPFAAGTCPGREECAEQVSAGKRLPPGEKPVAEHAAAQEAPEKKSPQAPDLLPKRAEREGVQKKNSGIQVAETFLFPGKQKTFRRIAHSTGKKLAMEKEADQMRRIAHDTGKKKRPARTAWPE